MREKRWQQKIFFSLPSFRALKENEIVLYHKHKGAFEALDSLHFQALFVPAYIDVNKKSILTYFDYVYGSNMNFTQRTAYEEKVIFPNRQNLKTRLLDPSGRKATGMPSFSSGDSRDSYQRMPENNHIVSQNKYAVRHSFKSRQWGPFNIYYDLNRKMWACAIKMDTLDYSNPRIESNTKVIHVVVVTLDMCRRKSSNCLLQLFNACLLARFSNFEFEIV